MITFNRRRLLAGGAVAGAGVAAGPALAQLRVTIDEGTIRPMPIAVPAFAGDDAQAVDLGQRMAEVIGADLDRSGLFRTIDPLAYIQGPDELRGVPRFADWRQINAEALVTGLVQLADGNLQASFRLYDVFTGNELVGLQFTGPQADWRRVAHMISDAVYSRITGEGGYFNTLIVYVSESGPATRRIKRISVMDQDGANHRFLTDGAHLVLTPRIAPNNRDVAYLSYAGGTPQVRLIGIDGSGDRRLGNFQGMTFSPRFSPDGRTLAMTFANGGNSDVYLVDAASGRERRLTDYSGIDTSPDFSPNGQELVFNSSRGGSPQLYIISAAGGNARRISFGEGRYGSPAWSPRGDLIAFVLLKGGNFHIGVMRPDGSDERLLTRAFLDEGPRFAPNGRVIVFSRTDPGRNITRLYSIDVTGYNIRELATPMDASDPDWSKLLG